MCKILQLDILNMNNFGFIPNTGEKGDNKTQIIML